MQTEMENSFNFIFFLSVLSFVCEANSEPKTVRKLTRSTSASFFLTCSSGKELENIKWFDPTNGQIVFATGGEKSIYVENEVSSEPTLIFRKTTLEDSGDYTCQGFDNDKRTTFSVTYRISFYKSISYKDAPLTQYAPVGTDHLIKCIADSTPPPIISWRYKTDKPGKMKFESFKSGLMVYDVDRSDQGDYVCVTRMATPDVSEFNERRIKLIVQYPPICSDASDHVLEDSVDGNSTPSILYSTYLESKVDLTCKVDSEPAPSFAWIRNKTTIQMFNHTSYSAVEFLYKNNRTSVLQVDVKNESMLGEYFCTASNFLGTCTKRFNIELAQDSSIGVTHVTRRHIGFVIVATVVMKRISEIFCQHRL